VSVLSEANALQFDLPGARVAFSTRRGGVSEGPYESLNLGVLTGDEPDRVRTNRERLAVRLQLDESRIAMGRQVHGAKLATWDGPPAPSAYRGPVEEMIEVDGHVTDAVGLALLVLTADCLPVALASPGRVAMLHAGWRGVAGGILERGVEAFEEPPVAMIGPGIGACCFEVGPEVLAEFKDVPGAARGRMLDLPRLAEARLRAAGAAHVDRIPLCTYCDHKRFFSHRREEGLTGRQGGLVWRTG